MKLRLWDFYATANLKVMHDQRRGQLYAKNRENTGFAHEGNPLTEQANSPNYPPPLPIAFGE
jgi:hypothetical protein